MKRPKFDKWVRGIDVTDSVAAAATRALRSRLKAVRCYLPLAAEGGQDDMEAVHELRVHTRRSSAALSLFAEHVPRRRAEWLRRQLKRIRKAAGDARDLDVLISRYADETSDASRTKLLGHLRNLRCQAQAPLVSVYERLVPSGKLDNKLKRFQETMKKRAAAHSGGDRFGIWARHQAQRSLERFLAATPENPADAQELHEFRICGKQLRYTMELLAPAFPAEFRKQLYRDLVSLQDRLGSINDHAAAIRHIEEWTQATDGRKIRQVLDRVREQEQRQLASEVSEFAATWSPQQVDDFANGLTRVLAMAESTQARP